jgi:HSP20 family molecular chaperone IbpA
MIRAMAEIAKGLENMSREFYEFVLPPVDIAEDENNHLVITADLAGFAKDRIFATVKDNVLELVATRDQSAASGVVHYRHRPLNIRKKVILPVQVDAAKSKATYENGVLTLRIPISDTSRINIA